MDKQRWQQVEQIYFSALERNTNEREAFLNAACADNETLRREVEALIACNEQAGEFLERPALEDAAEKLAADSPTEAVTQQLPFAQLLHHIGHYRLRQPLGKGGMGEVYLALDTRLNRKVGIKLLLSQYTHATDRVRRFSQEARAASALNHPNILTIYEIGKVPADNGDVHYLVTEYVEGDTLRQLAKNTAQAPLPIATVLELATQTTAALAAAHEAGIIHRDIKPENIMVRRDGLVKVLDFGLAKLTEMRTADFGMQNEEAETLFQAMQTNPHSAITNPQLTASGIVMGTPRYMSPEQARGQKVDARTDLFSLGVMLYELLAGRPPFAGQSPIEVISEILTSEPKALHSLRPDVPLKLEKIIHRLLHKDREKRYASAAELLTELKACQQELALATTTWSWSSLLKCKKLWLAASVLVCVLALGGWFWWPRTASVRLLLNSEFSELFVDLGRWAAPPTGWEIRDERLFIANQPIIGTPTNLTVGDFTMTFHLRLENAGGAAWALRTQDANHYYLFYLSGAKDSKNATSYFSTYIVRDGQIGVPVSRIPVPTNLTAGGEYTINITAKGNEITHLINSADAPSRDALGDPLGYFKDENNTYPTGDIGFRTVGQERFSVDELYLRPLNLQNQQ